jgi:8-oxo-dGTP pyrophosphatase MutT (NUDIX family)
MAHPGCWEFPGGKVESGESLGEALSRELREELDLQIEAGNVLFSETLPIDDCVLEIHFLEGRIASGSTLVLGEHDALDWVAPDQVAALKLAPGDVGFAQRMETILSSP